MKTWMKVALIFIALGAVAAWIFIAEGERQERLTAGTSATLTKVTLDEDEESSSLDETDLEYSFTASGQRLAGSDSLPGDKTADFKPGQTVKICYNPNDPSETDVRTDAAAGCGK